MFLFSGASGLGIKTIKNLDLTVGKSGTTTGRFFEIQTNSSGHVNTSGMIFRYNDGSTTRRLYGVTNNFPTDASAGAENDVARFINDNADNNGYGTGTVRYGLQGPLPVMVNDATVMEAGWKAEDAGTATDNASVATLTNQVSTLSLSRPTFATSPVWRNSTNGLAGRAGIQFNGTSQMFLGQAAATTIKGDAKTLFVAFKTPDDVANNTVQVVYKHGNQNTGMSVVMIGTSSTTEETIRLSIYSLNSGTMSVVSRNFTNIPKNKVYMVQMYFNKDGNNTTTNPKIGMSIDDENGQVGTEVKLDGTSFAATTINDETLGNPNTNISIGGRSGGVRFGEGYPGTAGTTPASDYNNAAGNGLYFGGTNGRFGEALLYNTADKDVRDAVYCYMRNKYFTNTANNNLEKGTPDDEVISGDAEFVNEVEVNPNPADADVNIAVAARAAGRIRVEVVDGIGRVIDVPYDDYATSNFTFNFGLDVRDYPSGMYAIRVVGAGDLNMTKSFIVRR